MNTPIQPPLVLFVALATTAILASGCVEQSQKDPLPEQERTVIQDTLEVDSGSVIWWEYSFPKGAEIEYDSKAVGETVYDIGVIQEDDIDRYRNGESVPSWAYNNDVTRASEKGSVHAGDFAFVISCTSSQACDVYVHAVLTRR